MRLWPTDITPQTDLGRAITSFTMVHRLDAGAKFCKNCGSALPGYETDPDH